MQKKKYLYFVIICIIFIISFGCGCLLPDVPCMPGVEIPLSYEAFNPLVLK